MNTLTEPKGKGAKSTLLRYRERDTPNGVTKATAVHVAAQLGINETQLIHMALAQFIARQIPRYEADDGPLSDADIAEIRRRNAEPAGKPKWSIID